MPSRGLTRIRIDSWIKDNRDDRIGRVNEKHPLTWFDSRYLVGSSSYFGRSKGEGNHEALEPQKTFCCGRMPGSSSRVPAGTTIFLPPWTAQGRDEPQFLQKHVAKYFASGCSKRPTCSCPFCHWNCDGGTNRFGACALPVNFLQREQWQYWKILNGGVIS